jgi:SAM-dependent methyltransferase
VFNINALNAMRAGEIEQVERLFRPGAQVLEIGAGTGQQAAEIARHGFEVKAIEVGSSNYSGIRMFPIIEYDGAHIPFPDASFDVVFSSNVLEHVPHLSELNRDIRRVLKPDGYCVHVMPTPSWRLWTTLTSIPAAIEYLLFRGGRAAPVSGLSHSGSGGIGQQLRRHFGRHGERGNVLSEFWLFRPAWWRRTFAADGFEVVRDEPVGIYYSGNTMLGARLSIERRKSLAGLLGSAGHIYVVRPMALAG